jgi:hypothetical protein
MKDWTPSELKRKAAVEAGRSVVANMRKGEDEQLIAWAKAKGLYVRIARPSIWGNPYKIGKHGTREEVIEKYSTWLWLPKQQQYLLERLPELRGKVLGCWCYPEPCHGNVLIEAAILLSH